MMTRLFPIFISLGLFLLSPAPGFGQDQRPCVPRDGHWLFIGQQKDIILDYMAEFGEPSGVMFYTSLEFNDGLDLPVDMGAGIQHGKYWKNYHRKLTFQIGLYLVGILEDIPQGKYDLNIQRLARWIKDTDRPVFLRIGYEFDNPENQYDPEKYKKAYRYIVQKFRNHLVDNVVFVWHSGAYQNLARDPMEWYPGDEYVDWIGVSYFGKQQIPKIRLISDLAKLHQKPLMIAESTPAGNHSTRAKRLWFEALFKMIDELDVKAVSYINSNWQDLPMFRSMRWGDARIQSDPVIRDLWNAYLESNPFLKS